MSQQPEERVVPMSTSERIQRRRSALFVTLFAMAIVYLVYLMLFGWSNGPSGGSTWISIAFMSFFGCIALFISVVAILDGFARNKILVRGTVTAKRIETAYSRTTSSSPRYYISLFDTEQYVDLRTYQQVHVGDSIELTLGSRARSVFDVDIIDPHVSTPMEERTLYGELDLLGRRIAKRRLTRMLLWRLPVVLVGSGAVSVVLFFAIVLSFPLVDLPTEFLRWLLPTSGLFWLSVGSFLLLRTPLRLYRDIRDGQVMFCTRAITDVVNSNRPLAKGNTIIITRYNAGSYQYIQASEFFLPAALLPPRQDDIAVGDLVTVLCLPRSHVVVGVA